MNARENTRRKVKTGEKWEAEEEVGDKGGEREKINSRAERRGDGVALVMVQDQSSILQHFAWI